MSLPDTAPSDDLALNIAAAVWTTALFAGRLRDGALSRAAADERVDALQHSRRVGRLLAALALYFDRDRSLYAAAGILHDVGKLSRDGNGQPLVEITAAPRGLSSAERAAVAAHGAHGAALIEPHFDIRLAEAAATHTDYDQGGLEFLQYALQAADIYDALRSPRAYKPARSHQLAILQLTSQAPLLPAAVLSFFADCGDDLFDSAWSCHPGVYGSDSVQLMLGLA